MQASTLGGIQ
jgi:hypothetical protein